MKSIFAAIFLTGGLVAAAQTPGVEVWAAPSAAKIRPDDRVEARNLVWDQRTRTVSVAGARNEHIPFQLVITVPPPERSHLPASGFFVEASDLASGGNRLSKEHVKLYFEHVILCPGEVEPGRGDGFLAGRAGAADRPLQHGCTIPRGDPEPRHLGGCCPPADQPAGE